MTLIKEVSDKVLIIAFKEDTGRLEQAFSEEGLETSVIRPEYNDQELAYSQSIRVLLSHMNAWLLCSKSSRPTIVVEADFIPCRGFSSMALPYNIENTEKSFGWLYTCGPTIYRLTKQNRGFYCRGHSAASVATIISPSLAKVLISYGKQVLEQQDPYTYYPWDSYMRHFVQKMGFRSYLATHNYGEHGGKANPEHKKAGLPATHRADVLAGPLHFLPDYANESAFKFLKVRAYAKFKGFTRVILLRTVTAETMSKNTWRDNIKMFAFAFKRLLTPY